MKFQFIAEHSREYSITLLCQALEVSESGYYAWKNRKVFQHCREDARLSIQVQQIFWSIVRSMAATEDAALVELARLLAVARRNPAAGLLHHSDRGNEFTSDRYQGALQELGI